MSLFEILVRGGWLMIPIALCSVVVVALGVGRYLILRRSVKELEGFLREWEDPGSQHDSVRFVKSCEHGPMPVAKMAAVFSASQISRREALPTVEAVATGELTGLEKGLGAIATLSAVTPMLGFLGTVTGMIRAFMQIQNLGGNVNASVLAGGIWEALITTAAGLCVGIPALMIHNYLANQIHRSAKMLEQCGELVMRHLGKTDEA